MKAAAACVFCQIASGELAASVVFADDDVVAFLDARPVFKGHTLVVPRPHVATFALLTAPALTSLFSATQRVSAAVEGGLEADGTFVAMNDKVSQSVPHVHVHVIPRRRKDGLRGFFWPRLRYEDDAERETFAARIRLALSA
ncbi:MAG TPA: HIT family protein [Polyangia bacterium]|jgi:histidine triad (HIT) family protein